MSWVWFTEGKEDISSGKIRPIFDAFLRHCVSMLGDDTPSEDEFQVLAYFIYDTLKDYDGGSLARKRTLIDAHIGRHVNPAALVEAAGAAQQLFQWRSQFRPKQPRPGAGLAGSESEVSRDFEEYGIDIVIRWPKPGSAVPAYDHVRVPAPAACGPRARSRTPDSEDVPPDVCLGFCDYHDHGTAYAGARECPRR